MYDAIAACGVEIRFHAQRSMTQSSITGLLLSGLGQTCNKAMAKVAYSDTAEVLQT